MLEILITIAVLIILSVIILGALNEFRDSRALSGAREEIIGALREARSRTLASENENQFGVHFETSRIIVFVGPDFIPDDPKNEIRAISLRTEIFNINFSGSDTVFKRLTGESDPEGNVSVRLKKDPSELFTVYLNSSGLVHD